MSFHEDHTTPPVEPAKNVQYGRPGDNEQPDQEQATKEAEAQADQQNSTQPDVALQTMVPHYLAFKFTLRRAANGRLYYQPQLSWIQELKERAQLLLSQFMDDEEVKRFLDLGLAEQFSTIHDTLLGFNGDDEVANRELQSRIDRVTTSALWAANYLRDAEHIADRAHQSNRVPEDDQFYTDKINRCAKSAREAALWFHVLRSLNYDNIDWNKVTRSYAYSQASFASNNLNNSPKTTGVPNQEREELAKRSVISAVKAA